MAGAILRKQSRVENPDKEEVRAERHRMPLGEHPPELASRESVETKQNKKHGVDFLRSPRRTYRLLGNCGQDSG
jgi:hypothetical protein